jgi:hypothetical protein
MSALDTIKHDLLKAVSLIEPLVELAIVAQKATGLGGDSAARALAIIGDAARAIEDAAAGQQTVQQATDRIAALHAALVADDKAVTDAFDAADAALTGRFPTS